MTRTTWITGAAGFIGRHVIDLAAARGDRVIGIGHAAGGVPKAAHGFQIGSLNQTTLDEAASDFGAPDLVVHLAGGSSVAVSIADPERDRSRTVDSTATLMCWMNLTAPNARLVAASSAAVYGADHDGPISEHDLTRPVSPYGEHKLAMEELIRLDSSSVQATIVRLFSVFGAGLAKQLFFDLARRAQAGERTIALSGTGAERRDYLCGSDAARLLLDAAEWTEAPARVVNGGAGRGVTIAQAAQTFADAWRAETGHTLQLTFTGDIRPGDPPSLVADISLLSELGFSVRSRMDEELRRFVRWFLERNRQA